jgi:hypothetical protein
MPFRRARTSSVLRAALCLTGVLGVAAVASAQSALDPRVLEFLPAPGVVTGYQAEISAASGQVLQVVNLGLPALQADGMIRADFASHLATPPVPGVAYVSKIVSTGPLGVSTSAASNPFSFSACSYRLALSIATVLPATAGPGAIDVTVTGTACRWTATSAAPWLTIVSAAGGSGLHTVAFTVTANPGPASRTATIAIGPLTYTATQDGAAGRTVSVATVAQLQAAIAALTANTTVVLDAGLYRLTAPLHVDGTVVGALTGVVLKGRTGRAADVVLDGPNAPAATGVPVPALWVSGPVVGLQVADLTIQHAAGSAVRFDAGVQAPHLSNLHLLDSGDTLIQTIAGVDDGVLEHSTLEATTAGSATGLDLRASARWTVRSTTFRALAVAISAHAGSADTLVEGNTVVNCATGIAFGLTPQGGSPDHRGGRIVNNFFYRAPSIAGGPAITVADSPATAILFNTVLSSHAGDAAIVYRFPATTDLVIANNLLDGPLQARDSAWATASGNVTTATANLFVYPAAGDLHLVATSAPALAVADASQTIATDIDGQPRSIHAATVGADEVGTGVAPTVQFTQPLVGTSVVPGTTVSVQATTTSAAPIAFVDLYVNAVALARLTTAPYLANVTLSQAGSYTVVAVAVDSTGARAASLPVVVTVAATTGR